MGLFRTFGGVGSLVGALFLGALADVLGFRWSLWIDGLLLMVVALAVMLVAKETAGRAFRATEERAEVARD